ncbi:hypothetical protein GF337_12930 [candidate division KSB1 bacterium]|nr:hypothetical protein [candidate division KSB1 bacterium]
MRRNFTYKQFLNLLLIRLCLILLIIPTYSIARNVPRQDSELSIVKINDIRYISIHDFADMFRARTFYTEKTKKMVVYLENKAIKITAFNPFIVVDDETYQMTVDTYFNNNEIYVPLTDFTKIIRQVFPDNINFNKRRDQLEITPPQYGNINHIEIKEKANGSLFRIKTSRNFTSADVGLRVRHGWLYVDIYGGIVDSIALARNFPSGIVSRIVPLQISDQIAQLSFKLRGTVLDKQLLLQKPNEILISVHTKQDISDTITNELEQVKKKWLIDKIVIDPGHGGKDPGAIGRGGTYEKDVTLGIALKLKDILREKSDIEVLMTRDDDRFIELKHRTEFANRNEAKLFISIHANSNPSKRIKGVSTYFLGPENTEEAREVALLENSVIKYEKNSKYADLSAENFILSAMAQNIYNTESEDLAAIVQEVISDHCNLIDRGVRQANFYVLWGASMPNILVETAFISNRTEERKLRTSAFQQKIAEALYKSIMKFKKKYEWGI